MNPSNIFTQRTITYTIHTDAKGGRCKLFPCYNFQTGIQSVEIGQTNGGHFISKSSMPKLLHLSHMDFTQGSSTINKILRHFTTLYNIFRQNFRTFQDIFPQNIRRKLSLSSVLASIFLHTNCLFLKNHQFSCIKTAGFTWFPE